MAKENPCFLRNTTIKNGFTLLELLIVIAIIAIIVAAIVIAISPGEQLAKARNGVRSNHIRSIESAFYYYEIDLGFFPDCVPEIGNPPINVEDCANSLTPKYLFSIPKDPLHESGCEYSYAVVRDGKGSLSIISQCAELGKLIHGGDFPPVVIANLQIFLDWGNEKCYSGENTFLNLIDSSRNDGYLKNNVTYSSMNGGFLETGGYNSGETDSVGDRIDINTSEAGIDRFSKEDDFTVSFWNYHIEGNGRVWSTGSAGSATGDDDSCIWQMWINSSQFYWWNSSGGGDDNITASFGGQFSQNKWQMVSIVYRYNENNNNVVRLYINDDLVGVGSTPTDVHSARDRRNQENMQWTLGGGYQSSCRTSNSSGRFGPFIFYNRALSEVEIEQNFNAFRSRFAL